MWNWILTFWPLLIVGLLILSATLLSRFVLPRPRYPYCKRSRLVTRAELRFYRSLHQAVDAQWAIFAMVRIADLLRVNQQARDRQAWLNRLLSKHIDFVLCDPLTLEPELAIELDDSSHLRADRRRRDRFVDWAFHSARFPLLRVEVSADYPAGQLRRLIDDAVGRR